MLIDLRNLLRTTKPDLTLDYENPEDRKYIIDFSPVRGGEIIRRIKNAIVNSADKTYFHSLFTGHIGCGKSTELLQLKYELTQAGFHVVYFLAHNELDLSDVSVEDLFLAIAHCVMNSLDQLNLKELSELGDFIEGANRFTNTEDNIRGEMGLSDRGMSFIAKGIGSITTKARKDSNFRDKLNQYLAPQRSTLLKLINEELLQPGNERLKQQGSKGLVVIVDNLDRMENAMRPVYGNGLKSQQEHLFIDHGGQLTELQCHIVYTLPLELNSSLRRGELVDRISDLIVLPMVPVKLKDGSECEEGMGLLRQMVLSKAFPERKPEERLTFIEELFDAPESLDRLCEVSGGHVRNLLRLFYSWIGESEFPLQRSTLESLIQQRQSDAIWTVNNISEELKIDGWEMLRQVKQKKGFSGTGYQLFIRNLYVYEYRYPNNERWFDINPILVEATELKS